MMEISLWRPFSKGHSIEPFAENIVPFVGLLTASNPSADLSRGQSMPALSS
jgi:hypothetical protein